jgi:serine/threonine protein kinase
VAQVANEAEVERLGRRAAFVAPELLETDAVCDARSDVYALGAIVYALLAGRGPCWTGTARSTLERAAGDGPEPLPDTVPPGLARVVTAMLASVVAFGRNVVPLLFWAALIVALTVIGFATFFAGLIVTVPWVGLATWHAYRALVEPVGTTAPRAASGGVSA